MATSRKLKLVTDTVRLSPTVRTIVTWTPQKIRSAQRHVESGRFLQAATICEWLLTDDRVEQGLNTRAEQLFGLPIQFEEPKGSTQANVKIEESEQDWSLAYEESELTEILQWGILLGAAPFRHPWTESATGRVIPQLEFWHPQYLRQDQETGMWYLKNSKFKEFEFIPGDGEWGLHTPGGRNRAWAKGVWRALALWVLAKEYARQDWARHSENNASMVIEAPEGADPADRKTLVAELQDRGADSVIALPNGFKASLLEVTANTKAIYEAQIEMANAAIDILLRGGNLTSQVQGDGSYAAAKQQAASGEKPKLRYDAQALSTTLYRQSWIWWGEFNFGSTQLAPWPAWPVKEKEDAKLVAESVNTMGSGLRRFQKLGARINLAKLVDRFDWDFIEFDDDGIIEPDDGDPSDDDAFGGERLRSRQQPPRLRAGSRAFLLAPDEVVDGQLYIDALTERGAARAQEALQPTIDAILEELGKATGFDDLRQRLRSRYKTLSPEALSELVHKAMTLAQLAGHVAANQGQ
jgi:phage gp29-like protein